MFSNKHPITAKLVGVNLVATFSNADPPLVWKFDLERNHSFIITLQGEDGGWELGVTSPKGEFYSVAHFPMREDAEEALRKVHKILLKKKRSLLWGIAKFIACVAALVLVLMIAGTLLVGQAMHNMMGASPLGLAGMPGYSGVPLAPPAPTPAAPAAIPNGVPVPADEVLKPPPGN